MLRDAQATQPSFAPPTTNSPNYFRMLWQRKLLLLLGLIVGICCGFWYNSKQPPVYRSAAKFQLVEPYTKEIPIQGVETQSFGNSNSDEQTLIMRSERVLTRAAELGKLDESPPFVGMTANEIGPLLSASSAFTVRALGATIYEISYTDNSPDTPMRVLQAVTDAYAEHLAEQQSIVGKETLTLIDQARGGVLKRLEELEQQFDKFKQSTPLVYRNGELASIHRDYADRYLSQRQDLVIKRTQTSSALNAAKEANQNGENLQSVLMLLESSQFALRYTEPSAPQGTEPSAPVGRVRTWTSDVKKSAVPAQQSRADMFRSETLFPLELQEQELLREVGENHPSVALLRSKMRMVQAQIEKIDASEQEYNRKVQQVLDEQKKQAIALQESADDAAMTDEQRKTLADKNFKKRIRLLVLAMQQQQRLMDHEIEVITEAHEREIAAMYEERSAEIELERLTREIERQQGLYDRIVARLDEVSILSGSEGIRVVPLESAKLGHEVTAIQSRGLLLGGLAGLGSMIGLCLLLGVERQVVPQCGTDRRAPQQPGDRSCSLHFKSQISSETSPQRRLADRQTAAYVSQP